MLLSNQEMRTFTTEYSEIGDGTRLAIRGFIESADNGGSVAILRGRWGLTSMDM